MEEASYVRRLMRPSESSHHVSDDQVGSFRLRLSSRARSHSHSLLRITTSPNGRMALVPKYGSLHVMHWSIRLTRPPTFPTMIISYTAQSSLQMKNIATAVRDKRDGNRSLFWLMMSPNAFANKQSNKRCSNTGEPAHVS